LSFLQQREGLVVHETGIFAFRFLELLLFAFQLSTQLVLQLSYLGSLICVAFFMLFDIRGLDFGNGPFAGFHTDTFIDVLLVDADEEGLVAVQLSMVTAAFVHLLLSYFKLLKQHIHITLVESDDLFESGYAL